MKLQTKFFVAITLVFIFLSAFLYLISINWINNNNVKEAQKNIEVHMDSAWDIYNQKRLVLYSKLEVLMKDKDLLNLFKNKFSHEQVILIRNKFEVMRKKLNIDILTMINLEGRVIFRTRPPYNAGDILLSDDPMVRYVYENGKCNKKDMILSRNRLMLEGDGLLEYCLENGGKDKGMLMGVHLPVFEDDVLLGYLQSGILLNGSTDIVDKIRDTIFYKTEYNGKPLGTATIFMGNTRISTNVIHGNNQRAIGTEVSEEVRKYVLNNGKSWIGKAMVLNNSYLSRYDPVRDSLGNIIGMLYVGELEEKYTDMKDNMVSTVMRPIFAGLTITLFIFFFLTKRILKPVKELSDATEEIGGAKFTIRVPVESGDELGKLSRSFNEMSEQLEEREKLINSHQKELKKINRELNITNKNYMEILGFVSHELKNRLASTNMRIYSLKNEYFGKLNDEQMKNVEMVSKSIGYFNEIIKNYLDLSRHEKGELSVKRADFNLSTDILNTVVEDHENDMKERKIRLENRIEKNLILNADMNLLRIVFDNLISNAIKYGKEQGKIILSSDKGKKGWTFSVHNDGNGIPEGKMKQLFKKFSRIESSASEGKKGTGLGLFICKDIIENHGGNIWAESKEGEWARFYFSIPF